MALIPLYEAKTYLRVDSSDEDALIGILLSSAEQMCKDVGRLSEDQWEAVNAADRDAENGIQPTRELEACEAPAVWRFCMHWGISMSTGTKLTITS